MEKFHCTAREFLSRVSSREITELQAYFAVEAEDRRR